MFASQYTAFYIYAVSETSRSTTFIFTITSANMDQFSYFFTVEFRKELRESWI